jgi:hypothetical protein
MNVREIELWEEPRRQFAECDLDFCSWMFGFVWWGELRLFQVHLGPLAITFNAFAQIGEEKPQP